MGCEKSNGSAFSIGVPSFLFVYICLSIRKYPIFYMLVFPIVWFILISWVQFILVLKKLWHIYWVFLFNYHRSFLATCSDWPQKRSKPQPFWIECLWWARSVNSLILRASAPVLSVWLQTVKFIVKNSNGAGLAQEISFSSATFCSLKWLVKDPNTVVYLQLDLTLAQYFWLLQVVCY